MHIMLKLLCILKFLKCIIKTYKAERRINLKVRERIISIRIMNKLQNNTKLSNELGIQAKMTIKDAYKGKTGEMNDYSNTNTCNIDSSFMAGI